MAWSGKAFLHHMDNDFQASGDIIEEVAPGLLLVRFDLFDEDSGKRVESYEMALIKVDELVARFAKDGSCDHPWEFFESRAKLDEFLQILDDLQLLHDLTEDDESAERVSVN